MPNMTRHAPALDPALPHRRLMRQWTPRLAFVEQAIKPWQRSLRRKVAALTGFDTFPRPEDRVPLRVRSIWRRALPVDPTLGTVEKILFTAEPEADVPAYVCLPDPARVPPPWRWMICVQGHSTGMHNSIAVSRTDESQAMEVPGDRDFAVGCLRQGMAALCIEQRAFGERTPEPFRGQPGPDVNCQLPAMRAIMLGRTLLAERVFDVDRGLDYLATRRDVRHDPAGMVVGIMGNSGGGTTSLYAGALLDRVRFMMPSCSFCTFAASILSITHCTDNYVPGLARWAGASDVLGLFAPRPVVIVAGRSDPLFPLPGVREAFRAVKKIYTAAKATEACQLVVGEGGHRFYAKQGWAAMMPLLATFGLVESGPAFGEPTATDPTV